MASDEENDARSRRRRHDDDGADSKSQRRGRDHDRRFKQSDRDSHRSERRERRDRQERRRSRTPESSRRRSRSRDRKRRRDRDDQDRDHGRRRSRDRERDSRRRRHDDDDQNDKQLTKRNPLKRSGPLPSQEDSFAITNGDEPEKPKEKPNFGATGALAAASNSVTQADGSRITLKYHEPAEARKASPRDVWKLFVFKGGDVVDTIDLGARSCWLIGRDVAVVDLVAEHPSLSKQHAVIQFRYTEKRNEFGDKLGKVKPYIIDLESANGTMLNDDRIPEGRYLELRDKDMLQFGHSTREYVIMLAPRD